MDARAQNVDKIVSTWLLDATLTIQNIAGDKRLKYNTMTSNAKENSEGYSPTDVETRAIEVMTTEAHIINFLIETIDYVDGKVISATVNKYLYASNRIVLSQKYKTQLSASISSDD